MKIFSYNEKDMLTDELKDKIENFLFNKGYKSHPDVCAGNMGEICSMVEHYDDGKAFYALIKNHCGNGKYNGFGYGYFGFWE